MHKSFKCIVILLLLFCLTGCNKEITQVDFMAFSEKCRAENYYQTCNEITDGATTYFYYNHNKGILFETYTMLKKCKCDFDVFNTAKSELSTKFNAEVIVWDYCINNIEYDIFWVENTNRLYSDFQEFGFVAINDEKYYIDFYWFYNPDYDNRVYDEESFDAFFKENYSWVSDKTEGIRQK